MRALLAERDFPVDAAAALRVGALGRHARCRGATARSSSRTRPRPTSPGSTSRSSPPAARPRRSWRPRSPRPARSSSTTRRAWRKDPEVPLVVSEVNAARRSTTIPKGIVANPNCTTMAAMPVLKPLHDEAGLVRLARQHLPGRLRLRRRRRAGARRAGCAKVCRRAPGRARARRARGGRPRAAELYAVPDRLQRRSRSPGSIVDDGSLETDEEQKLRNESRKILRHPRPARSRARACACPSSPVTRSRSTPSSPTTITPERGARAARRRARRRSSPTCPTPLEAAGRDDVYVGRVRADQAAPEGNGLALFVVGDNLRKGAALNAVQIAEELLARR